MSLQFNEDGYIFPGLIESSLDVVEEFLVNEFPLSQTRENRFKNLINWLSSFPHNLLPNEIWIDGSFASNKENPNDIDVVVLFSISEVPNEQTGQIIQGLLKSARNFHIDAYFTYTNDEHATPETINNRNYWRGQFGFDRQDIPKGIIIIKRERMISYLRGR